MQRGRTRHPLQPRERRERDLRSLRRRPQQCRAGTARHADAPYPEPNGGRQLAFVECFFRRVLLWSNLGVSLLGPGMLLAVAVSIPETLLALASRSPAPRRVALAFERLATELPNQRLSRLAGGQRTSRARAFTAVCAASDSLGRFCITEPAALQVLGDLDS